METERAIGAGFLWLYWGIVAFGVLPGFFLNAMSTRKSPSLPSYRWGYSLGCSLVIAAIVFLILLIFTDKKPHPLPLLAVIGAGTFSVLWLGWSVVRRNRLAFILASAITFNPLVWIVGPRYIRRRWGLHPGFADPTVQRPFAGLSQKLGGWWRLWIGVTLVWVVFNVFPLPEAYVGFRERGAVTEEMIASRILDAMDLRTLELLVQSRDEAYRESLISPVRQAIVDSLGQGQLPDVSSEIEHRIDLLVRQTIGIDLLSRVPRMLALPLGLLALSLLGRWILIGFQRGTSAGKGATGAESQQV